MAVKSERERERWLDMYPVMLQYCWLGDKKDVLPVKILLQLARLFLEDPV